MKEIIYSLLSDIDSMIAVEQCNDGEKDPKAFWERYCKKVYRVDPSYITTLVEGGGFISELTIPEKGTFTGSVQRRKVEAEKSAAYQARKELGMIFT